MISNIQLLDCTLRDGGLGFEDAEKNHIASICFDTNDVMKIASNLASAKIDVIEIGSIEITNDDRRKFAIYPDIETISRMQPKPFTEGQVFAGLYRGPDTPVSDIPVYNGELCSGTRVIIRYSELKKSMNFCASLCEKGYKVFVQPMITMRYSEEEILYMIDECNKMKAYALYIVDSYGYMQQKDIERLFSIYDKYLDKDIRIGFHAHNNMNLALSNVISFMEMAQEREVIIDSCLLGIGQGAGNLQTELMLGYFYQQNKLSAYDYNSVLDACEIVEKYSPQNLWGYSVSRLLPAIHRCAYKYAIVLRKIYGLTYREINDVLSRIPEGLRQRYTTENVVELLKCTGYGNKLKADDL